MARLPGYDKKTADPVIRRQYEDMRNARRYPHVVRLAQIVRLISIPLVFAIAWWHPLSDNGTMLLVLGILAAFLLSMGWMLVMWMPHGKRLLAFNILVGVLLFAAAVMGLLTWLQAHYHWTIP